jgi:hypothetical protein
MNNEQLEHLPAFTSWEECQAYSEAKKDNFYLIAFMIEAWVGDVNLSTVEHYAENKSGKRHLQTGIAWESWRRVFGTAKPEEWPNILTALSRFSNCDAVESDGIKHITNLVALEDHYGEPVSISARMAAGAEQALTQDKLCRKTRYLFQRMAEWLEAIIHWNTHLTAAIAPKLLQPSQEKRELYQLGLIQRNHANLDAHGKAWWQFRHGDMANQFSGKRELGMIGQAQANEKWGSLKRPQVDQLTIHWWPLLKRYHWTDRDMRLLIRQVVDRPDEYPLNEDKDFADYRQKALGLKKTKSRQDRSSPEGHPRGWKVAMAMVRGLEDESSE